MSSFIIGLSFGLLFLAIFTAQVVGEWFATIRRDAKRSFCLNRVENVFPKFKL